MKFLSTLNFLDILRNLWTLNIWSTFNKYFENFKEHHWMAISDFLICKQVITVTADSSILSINDLLQENILRFQLRFDILIRCMKQDEFFLPDWSTSQSAIVYVMWWKNYVILLDFFIPNSYYTGMLFHTWVCENLRVCIHVLWKVAIKRDMSRLLITLTHHIYFLWCRHVTTFDNLDTSYLFFVV